jgi:N-methylhydantoinase A
MWRGWRRSIIAPPNAGVGSEVGFLAAPISYEMVKTQYMRLDSFNAAATELLSGMARDIRAWVEPAAAGEPVVERRVAFMRCVGQGHEIAVELPVRDLLATDTAALHTQYAADYEKLFRRSSGRGDRNHGLVRQCLDRLAAARADCRR